MPIRHFKLKALALVTTIAAVASCASDPPVAPSKPSPASQLTKDAINIQLKGTDLKLMAIREGGVVRSALLNRRGDVLVRLALEDVPQPKDAAAREAFARSVAETSALFASMDDAVVRHDVVAALMLLDRSTRGLSRASTDGRGAVLGAESVHVGHLASVVVRAADAAKPAVIRGIPSGAELVRYLANVDPGAIPLAYAKEPRTAAGVSPRSGPGECGGCFGAWGPNCAGSGSSCSSDPNGKWVDPATGQSYDCASNFISVWHDQQCCVGNTYIPLCGMDPSQNNCNLPGAPMPNGCGNILPPSQGGGTCSQFTSCSSLCGAAGVRTQQMWPDCTCVCNQTNYGGSSNGGYDDWGWGGGGGGGGGDYDDWWWDYYFSE